ncbi:hypothetical protein HA466_0048980 [Hirschfeldia incana]|nr:hypothetical protein HA466_0048980 [Hirschfeldia incana]
MEAANQTVICQLLAVDLSDYCYRVCSRCERVLPGDNNNNNGGVFSSASSFCKFCKSNAPKLMYRILMSVVTDTSVKTVICFDRAATVLFGCSADEFFHFTKLNPKAASMVNQVFDGEMLRMTLTRPKNLNAQHLRVTSVVPLRSGFQPAIVTLTQLCASTKSQLISVFLISDGKTGQKWTVRLADHLLQKQFQKCALVCSSKHQWSSGRIVPCHGIDPGSIPGWCTKSCDDVGISKGWVVRIILIISDVTAV